MCCIGWEVDAMTRRSLGNLARIARGRSNGSGRRAWWRVVFVAALFLTTGLQFIVVQSTSGQIETVTSTNQSLGLGEGLTFGSATTLSTGAMGPVGLNLNRIGTSILSNGRPNFNTLLNSSMTKSSGANSSDTNSAASPSVVTRGNSTTDSGSSGGGSWRSQIHDNGAAPANETFHINVNLNLRNVNELDSFLTRVSNASSPDYRHFLTPRQFDARYGPTPKEESQVVSYLAKAGLRITARYPSRMLISAVGTNAAIEHAFGLKIHNVTFQGQEKYAALKAPTFPKNIASVILGVTGLNNLSEPHPLSRAFAPNDAANFYDTDTGYSGAGQTVIIASASQYLLSDIHTYDTTYGLPTLPTGSKNICMDQSSCPLIYSYVQEADLDVEVLHATAPEAVIKNYVAASPSWVDLQSMYQRIVNDNKGHVVTTSIGGCESEVGPDYVVDFQSIDNTIKAGTAVGQTWFAASGDQASKSCTNSYSSGTPSTTTSFPLAGPNTTGSFGQYFSSVPNGGTGILEYVCAYMQAGSGSVNVEAFPFTNGQTGSAIFAGTITAGSSNDWYCTDNPVHVPTTTRGTLVAAVNGQGRVGYNVATSNNGDAYAYAGGSSWTRETTQDYLFKLTAWDKYGASAPADSPHVTAVGGTIATCGSPCTGYGSEAGWDQSGGAATLFSRPSWQTGCNVPGKPSARVVPDIAMEASPGYRIRFNGQWTGLGGTSAAAPKMAGILALLNQADGTNQGFGLINPQLYSLAESNVFHDVTTGTTFTGDHAGPGWDIVTGLGSVDISQLISLFPRSGGQTWAGGPSNDCFSNPASLTGSPTTTTVNTRGATLQVDEPRPCGSIGDTTWYTWTAPASGTATVSTVNSNTHFDTVLAAYTGTSLQGLTQVACNDNSGGTVHSQVSFTCTKGTTYRIQLGGADSKNGTAEIDISGCQSGSLPTAPTGLNAAPGDHSIALSWNAADGGGSPIQYYKVYRGTSSGGEAEVPSSDPCYRQTSLSCMETGLTNGQPYYYKVSAVNGNGEGPKSTEASGTPTLNGEVIFQYNGYIESTGAYGDSGSFGAWAGIQGNAPITVTYRYCYLAGTNGASATIKTKFDNTVVDSFSFTTPYTGGGGCTRGDPSTYAMRTFTVSSPGISNSISFDWVNGDWRVSVADITVEAASSSSCTSGGPANDCFADASTLSASSATVNTAGATTESGEPSPCGSMGATVWYKWTAPSSGTVYMSTVNGYTTYDTVLAAYTGSNLAGLNEKACNDDDPYGSGTTQSTISFTCTAGQTYMIQLGGYAGATGNAELDISGCGVSGGTIIASHAGIISSSGANGDTGTFITFSGVSGSAPLTVSYKYCYRGNTNGATAHIKTFFDSTNEDDFGFTTPYTGGGTCSASDASTFASRSFQVNAGVSNSISFTYTNGDWRESIADIIIKEG